MRYAAIGSISPLILVIVCGCVDAQEAPTSVDRIEPAAVYKGEFDHSKIGAVESIVDEVAQRWRLRIFRKNREHMKHLTQGRDAFFVALYFENDAVLALTNVGVGTVLTMITTDHGKMPLHELNGVASDIVDMLRTRLSINLHLEPTRADSIDN